MNGKHDRADGTPRELEEITDLLGAIVERVGGRAGLPAADLVAAWDQVVPQRWRSRSRPIGIRQGVLLVEVPSGADATLLGHDTAAVLSEISRRYGPGVVDAVRLRVSGRHWEGKTPRDLRVLPSSAL